MSTATPRDLALDKALNREMRKIDRPLKADGTFQRVSDYYGVNTFDFSKSENITDQVKKELDEVSHSRKPLTRDAADAVAKAVTKWALDHGCTHFCHWFQPLTGSTAEKHDAFVSFSGDDVIEKFSGSQLMQGEPDASSFPSGGARSTFEARGYTAWDMTSPMFISEGVNGKTLNIPTGFVSYHGDALDIKTPLLRSVDKISETMTKFLGAIGEKGIDKVVTTCGAEQEYFLVDKSFYAGRPDLVMTGRALFGCSTSRNQQLDDHYFGNIPERVKAFMDELNLDLHRLGIPAKTQHNEVAPGQFEIAPIFEEMNVSADHNQVMMKVIRDVASRHNFVALLHEKPFPGINGSGKHLNWSMATNTGINLLEPGDNPESNTRFLAVVAGIIEAVNRRGDALRMAIASHGNDHRLGANEAPPSIISIFLGETLDKIFTAIRDGESVAAITQGKLDLGASQLANLLKDNTDRNRTSPFAFTGNKFEFRAVGSSHAVGFPSTILNAAVIEVFQEACAFIEKEIAGGKTAEQALKAQTKKWVDNSYRVVFNGDGYSDEWVKEAEERGLPNLRTSADALDVLRDKERTKFLVSTGVLRESEIEMRYNAFVEKYITCREIEFNTLSSLVHNSVIPSAVRYKETLSNVIFNQKQIGLESSVEVDLYKRLSFAMESLYATNTNLRTAIEALPEDTAKAANTIAKELMPLSETIAEHCNTIESLVPDDIWGMPKFYDMLFVK